MASQTEENYLKSLFLLADTNGEISLSDLSKAMEISIPTANSMVNKLHTKGLLKYKKYKPLSLTSKGKKEAALIIRKHRLTEIFLVEVMGFGWEQVHEIAEQIEHINSSVFFERMDELLSFPTIDPHGSPIPDKNGKIVWKSHENLSNCKVGQKVKLVALSQSSDEFLKFLNAKNICLGMKIEILSIEVFDQSMLVLCEGLRKEHLSFIVSEKLLVEVL
ncbi:MAG: metal-dependent transcriptional regulator [Saprospiraceae bacterium]